MGIFLSRKNTLRCPECGGYADKNDGYSICPNCGCDLISEDEYRLYANPSSTSSIVECPYCYSKDTKKITNTSKMINTAVWGIFGTKRFKEWHCNNCNSDF